jgi:hypothetical protein
MRTEPRIPLESRLADLGAEMAFPATPPIATVVGEQLRHPRPGLGRRQPISRGVALALAATLLLVGVAAAAGIALGGLRLVFGPASFSPLPTLVVGPGLGEATSLSEARQQVTFTLRVPALTELGQPDLVYVAEPPAGGAVTLLYGDRAGFPAPAVTGIGLVITQFRADIGPDAFEKMIDSGVSVTDTRVNGQAAWWVAGGEHYFFYRDANGRIMDETLRLAGNTLIWEEGGVTHRVEGAPTLAAATRVAESLR